MIYSENYDACQKYRWVRFNSNQKKFFFLDLYNFLIVIYFLNVYPNNEDNGRNFIMIFLPSVLSHPFRRPLNFVSNQQSI